MQNYSVRDKILKESYDTKFEFSYQNKMYHLLEWHMLILFLASMKCLHHFLRIIFWVLKVNSQLLKPSISIHSKPGTTPRKNHGTRLCPNVSTTPLQQWGFRQCLPFSWTILGGKHCRHPIAVMEVVDTFKLWMTRNTELKITMKKSTEVTKNNQASEWFPKKIVKSALSILWNLQTTLLVFWYTLVAMPAPKKSLPIRPAENSAVPHAYFLCLLSWSILINIDRIWWYQTIDWALSILRLPRK